MKRKNIVVLLMVLVSFLLVTNSASAQFSDEIESHWISDYIKESFYDKYFEPKNDDLTLTWLESKAKRSEFEIVIDKIIEDSMTENQLENIHDKIEDSIEKEEKKDDSKDGFGIVNIAGVRIMRFEMVDILIEHLNKYEVVLPKYNSKIKFTDLNQLSEGTKKNIKILRDLELINGYDDETFGPSDWVKNSQMIVVSQRLEKLLGDGELKTTADKENDEAEAREESENKDLDIDEIGKEITIPFSIERKEEVSEGVKIETKNGKLYISITKEFSTSGYDIGVSKIVNHDKNKYKIYMKVKKPRVTDLTLQVISYANVVVVVDQKEFEGGAVEFSLAWPSEMNIDQGIDN